MRNEIAVARRSSLLSTYGVGSLYPADDTSVMICGLDEWPAGPEINEPRLSASLGVEQLRAPSAGRRNGDVPVVRFPEWVFCTSCRRLGPHWEIVKENGRCRDRECLSTSISPSRFVVCCLNGHIEDFPYRAWAHEDASVPSQGHALRLVASGSSSSLGALRVVCDCGQTRSLEGAFSGAAFTGLKRCSGQRPWLTDSSNEPCHQPLRSLQRGSANVWYARTRSTISIPSVARTADAFVRTKLQGILAPGTDPKAAAAMFKSPDGCTVEDIERAIVRMQNPAAELHAPSEAELRTEEYNALVQSLDDVGRPRQFETFEQTLTGTGIGAAIAQLSRVSRLREVRALHGFTRIVPELEVKDDGEPNGCVSELSTRPQNWLPAMEVLGEGVFIRLESERLKNWETTPFARRRAATIQDAQERTRGGMHLDHPTSPRSLLLHSLAHALLDELSLAAGYPAASLRERIYDEDDQCGVLIYTATADSAGSLGGLAALADPGHFAAVLESAIERARWCTADPICIEAEDTGVNAMNLAACHACLLLPETSCERFNAVLDRAALIGIGPQDRDGFFDQNAATY